MNEPDFENFIKQTMKTYSTPSRSSLEHVLSKIDREPVTNNESVRYTTQTATSNIINNKVNEIINIWKSKRIILVPSFILLLFVGAFSLSSNSNSALLKFVEQDAQIEEPVIEYEDEILIDAFDTPGINDLGTIENEI